MSDRFIKTNQGYVRASAVNSVIQVVMGDVIRLDGATTAIMHFVSDRSIEDVVAELEGRGTAAHRIDQEVTAVRTGLLQAESVSKPAQERLGFGSVVDAKPRESLADDGGY